MKKKIIPLFSFLLLSTGILIAQSFPVTLRLIDYMDRITNDQGENYNTNIIVQLDDNLKAQNPRDPSPEEWWYPMYGNSGISPEGVLLKSDASLIWEITLKATPGTYQWVPYAKSLGWNPVKNSGLINYEGDGASFSVSETGEITGITSFEIGEAPAFTTEVTLKVLDYSKGQSTGGAGKSDEKNILAWVEQGYCGNWWCPFYEDGSNNGLLTKFADHWEWKYTLHSSRTGTFRWAPYIGNIEDNDSELPEELLTNIVYASGEALTETTKQAYNIYLPAGRSKEKTPVVFVIHGGSWQSGDRADYNMEMLKEYFPGAAIVTVGYRLFVQERKLGNWVITPAKNH